MTTHSSHTDVKENEIGIGDYVKLIPKVEWVNEPQDIVITDIKEISESWIVAEINGTYSHSDGKESNEILLSNLEKDVSKTRDLLIDQLISDDVQTEDLPPENKDNK